MLSMIAAVALASAPAGGFQALRWGMTSAEVRATWPDAKETRPGRLLRSDRIAEMDCLEGVAFADGQLATVQVFFRGDFGRGEFTRVSRLLTEKYGAPAEARDPLGDARAEIERFGNTCARARALPGDSRTACGIAERHLAAARNAEAAALRHPSMAATWSAADTKIQLTLDGSALHIGYVSVALEAALNRADDTDSAAARTAEEGKL